MSTKNTDAPKHAFKRGLLCCKPKLTYIINFTTTQLASLTQWMGCFILTLFLLTGNICVIINKKITLFIFTCWDKFMDYFDRKRIIKERTKESNKGIDYLIRYYLFLKGSSGSTSRRFPYNVFLHKFLKSDEPVMHDHPWSYTTLIISGGYWEHIPIQLENGRTVDSRFWRGPGYWSSYSSNHKHWIELPENAVGPLATNSCWTVFIPGVKKTGGKWGFYPSLTDERNPSDQWIESDQYLATSDEKKDS